MRDESPAVSPASKQADDVPNPKLGVRLDEGVSPPDEDLLNRHRTPGRTTISPTPRLPTIYGKSTPRSHSDEKAARDQRADKALSNPVVAIEIASRARARTALRHPATRHRHLLRGVEL